MLALKKTNHDDLAVDSVDHHLSPKETLSPEGLLRERVASARSIERIALGERGWEIHATFESMSEQCPACNGKLGIHSWSHSTFLDAPVNSTHVHLHVRRPRLQCRNCEKTLTPVVHGIIENARVTQRFVDHVQNNLWAATSLRSFASSVGALPKTITGLLRHLAEESRKEMAIPTEVGIHELSLNDQRHLLLFNLAIGTVVDFLPSVDDQVVQLSKKLCGFNENYTTQIVSVPAEREIVDVAESSCPSARIELSFGAIHILIARVVAKLGAQESKQGRVGSVSSSEAERLAYLRRKELSGEDNNRLTEGLHSDNPFWKLFDAKEQLLSSWETAGAVTWIDIFHSWFQKLPLQWQPAFHGLLLLLSTAQKLGVSLVPESRLPFFDLNIRALQRLLSKPGKSFSPEMLAALVLVAPLMSVPLKRKVGIKAAGPIWVEEAWMPDKTREPSSAGVSLESLVNLLSAAWDPPIPDAG